MSEPTLCSDCDAEIPPAQPKGLCPRCALEGALELSDGESQVLQTEDSANASPPQPVAPVGQLPTLSSAGEPADGLTPEQVFERRWVQALMDQATFRLREEYVAKGEIALYDQLKDLQPNERGALRRYQQLLREVIAHTVNQPSEIENEIRYFIRVSGG